MDQQTLSVCYKLSTRDRLDTLQYSLTQAKAQVGEIETVLAVPPTLKELARNTDNVDTVCVVLNPSLTHARNRTASAATGGLVAFVDSDAWPTPGWADTLRRAIPDRAAAAGGPLHPRDDLGWLPAEWHWLVGCGPYYDEGKMVPNTYGSNFAVATEAFKDVGGFDESAGMGSDGPQQGAETDLARRLRAAGYDALWYDPDAVVIHDVGPSDAQTIPLAKRAYEQGVAKATLGTGDRESAFLTDELPKAIGRGPVSALSSVALTLIVGAGFVRGKLP